MSTESERLPRRERRHFTAQQKVALVKRHLLESVAVSDLCDEAQITPTQFYQWRKQLFEGAAAAFEKKPGQPARPSPVERRVAHLEQRLATKNEVIAELTEENVRLKKVDGLLRRADGSNRTSATRWSITSGRNRSERNFPRNDWWRGWGSA